VFFAGDWQPLGQRREQEGLACRRGKADFIGGFGEAVEAQGWRYWAAGQDQSQAVAHDWYGSAGGLGGWQLPSTRGPSAL